MKMYRTCAMLLLTMLIVSCTNSTDRLLLSDYRCSDTQLDMVSRQMRICGNVGLRESVCFKAATKSQCDLIININSQCDEKINEY